MANFFNDDIIRCPKCGGIYFKVTEFFGLAYYPEEDIYKEANNTKMVVCKKCGEVLDIDLSKIIKNSK